VELAPQAEAPTLLRAAPVQTEPGPTTVMRSLATQQAPTTTARRAQRVLRSWARPTKMGLPARSTRARGATLAARWPGVSPNLWRPGRAKRRPAWRRPTTVPAAPIHLRRTREQATRLEAIPRSAREQAREVEVEAGAEARRGEVRVLGGWVRVEEVAQPRVAERPSSEQVVRRWRPSWLPPAAAREGAWRQVVAAVLPTFAPPERSVLQAPARQVWPALQALPTLR
jgi:hypothetical protein